MKKIVSFETAKALKDAGFPQPAPEAGQFWYLDEHDISGSVYQPGVLFVFIRAWRGFLDGVFFAVNEYTQQRGRDFAHNPVFAPATKDILQELPENYYLGKDENGFNIKEFLWFGDSGYEFNIVSHSDNPAEAAASAWLALKKDLEV